MKKIRLPGIFPIISIIGSLIFPTSYDAIIMSIPWKLIWTTTKIAYWSREFYRENRWNYRYSIDSFDFLDQLSGFYDLKDYAECGKFLDSNFFKRKIDEKTLKSSCMISYPLSSIDYSPKKQDTQFFYWCLIDGNEQSYCLWKYK